MTCRVIMTPAITKMRTPHDGLESCPKITAEEVVAAVQRLKTKKALDPDGVAPVVIKILEADILSIVFVNTVKNKPHSISSIVP